MEIIYTNIANISIYMEIISIFVYVDRDLQ